VKSFDTPVVVVPYFPDFKPPSPENPSQPLRVSQMLRELYAYSGEFPPFYIAYPIQENPSNAFRITRIWFLLD